MSDEQQSFIKTPQQLIKVVVLAFVVPIAIILLLAKFVGTGQRTGAGADAMTPAAIEARLQPVAGFELRDASAPAAPEAPKAAAAAAAPKADDAKPAAAAAAPVAAAATTPAAATPAAAPAAAAPTASAAAGEGKKVYDTTCMVCHGTGVAGAPKYGDKAAWAPRIATGHDTLVKNSISGIRAMPPRGGNGALSDAQLRAAVDYMLAAVK